MHVTQIWHIGQANPEGLSTLHMPFIYSHAEVQLPCVVNVCKKEKMEGNVSDLHAKAAHEANLSSGWKRKILKLLPCLQIDYILTSHLMTPQQLKCFEINVRVAFVEFPI